MFSHALNSKFRWFGRPRARQFPSAIVPAVLGAVLLAASVAAAFSSLPLRDTQQTGSATGPVVVQPGAPG